LLSSSSLCRGGSHRALLDGGVGSWQHGLASCSWQGTEALLLVPSPQGLGLLRGVAPASEREPGRDSWTGMGERASPLSGGPHHGDVNEPRDIDGGPGEGSLPSLTVLRSSHSVSAGWGGRAQAPTALESTRSEIGLNGWQSAPAFGASGAPSPILENLGEVAPVSQGEGWPSRAALFPAGRASSHPSVLITASGPHGEQPLAGRIT